VPRASNLAAARPVDDESDEDDEDVGPPAPPAEPVYDPDAPELGGLGAGPGIDTYDDEEDADAPPFPTTHELALKDHTKVISALAIDPSGARFASGAHDYDVKLWDFGGMDHRLKPFKTWEPAGSYYVRQHTYGWFLFLEKFSRV
jgi:WD repeat-containing protein 70